MVKTNIEELYARHIQPLPREAQLRLLAKLAEDLAASDEEKPKRNIMELHGLGAEIWEGIDAQEYVNKLRAEWDHRP
jgi:hypothetical protein